MRCLSCGAEMRLIQTVPHETIEALEHRTFECSACSDIEGRLMLGRSVAVSPTGVVPVHEAPPMAHSSIVEESSIVEPPSLVEGEDAKEADHALLRNAWAMLKGQRSGS
jgi:hypothetical protein